MAEDNIARINYVLAEDLVGHEPDALETIAEKLDSNLEQIRLEGAQLMAGLILSQVADRQSCASIAYTIRHIDRDPLTGLLLRNAFERNVEDRIKELGAHECRALLFIDLRHFGAINNEIGYLAGDETLRAFAQSINDNFRTTHNESRSTDIVSIPKTKERTVASRPGGDEYFILVDNGNNLTRDSLTTIASNKMIEVLLNDTIIAVMEKNHITELGIKVGYALVDSSKSYDQIITEADPKINTFKSYFVTKSYDKYIICEEINLANITTLDEFYLFSELIRIEKENYVLLGVPIASRHIS